MSIEKRLLERLDRLMEIGIALSTETNHQHLLEMILEGARSITYSDGGTLYSVQPEAKTVTMEIVRNESLNFRMGGSSGKPIPFPPIPLSDAEGNLNYRNVVTYAVNQDITVNITDAYHAEGFDFSGTRKFDHETGYRSQSFLAVPLKNHENQIIGVLQLINARDPDTGEAIPFDTIAQRLTEALASQAAIALTKKELIDSLKELFESFIKLLATALDEKSPYNGKHCRRVPIITMMLADAVHRFQDGPLRDFRLLPQERYTLEIASWLHDCGKITTPEYVIDKATKLETIFDRLHMVNTRFEVLQRDAEIDYLKARLAALERGEPADEQQLQGIRDARLAQIESDRQFVAHCNTGGEFMAESDRQRIRDIGQQSWILQGETVPFLNENEFYNLCIPRGTLTEEERKVINKHIEVTITMLEQLPFPKSLLRVAEYAGGHHERMDGKGYPNGLTREQMSVPARIMGIADIFEALTASDRPYKPAKKLSETLKIMHGMKTSGHIDPDLFDIFLREGIYLEYANSHLKPEQIDSVDITAFL